MQDLIDTIEAAFEARAEITPANVSASVRGMGVAVMVRT